jgi:hypothetical protein
MSEADYASLVTAAHYQLHACCMPRDFDLG